MKALCAAGKSQELNCYGNIESTSCCNDKFLPKRTKQSEVKSVFAGPSVSVDIEFKDVSYSVKLKGRGEINMNLSYSFLFFYMLFCITVY